MSKSVTGVVDADGVTVEKSFEPDEFPVPAIAFVLTSDRDEGVTVRVTDELPEGVAADDVGFHPEFGEEFWSVEDGALVFERDLSAGETVTTVYALRDQDLDTVESFLGDPGLTVDAEPASGDDGTAPDDTGADGETTDGDVAPRVSADAGDSADETTSDGGDADGDAADGVPGLDEEAQTVDIDDDGDGDAEDEEIEPIELNDPSGVERSAADAPSNGTQTIDRPRPSDGDDAPRAPTAPAAGGVAAALARELRDGSIDSDVQRALRDALGSAGPSGSERAQLSAVRDDVSKLRAYVDALEEFLDENGDAQELLRDLRGELESLASRVDEVRGRTDRLDARLDETGSRVEANEAGVESLGDRLADTDDTVGAVDDRVETLDEDVDALEARTDDLRESLASLDDRADETDDRVGDVETELAGVDDHVETVEREIDAVREEIDDLYERTDDTADAVGTLDATTADLDDRVGAVEAEVDRLESLSDRVDALESTLADVDDLPARLDETETELEEFRAFRERMAGVFGGDGPDQ